MLRSVAIPVGVGKTFLPTTLDHIACRRKVSVHFERVDRLHRRLKARALINGSYDAELRKLIGVDLLDLRWPMLWQQGGPRELATIATRPGMSRTW